MLLDLKIGLTMESFGVKRGPQFRTKYNVFRFDYYNTLIAKHKWPMRKRL